MQRSEVAVAPRLQQMRQAKPCPVSRGRHIFRSSEPHCCLLSCARFRIRTTAQITFFFFAEKLLQMEEIAACWKCTERPTLLTNTCWSSVTGQLARCWAGVCARHERIKVKFQLRGTRSRAAFGAARGDGGTTCQKSSLTVLFLDTILSSFFAIRTRSSSGVIAAFRRPWRTRQRCRTTNPQQNQKKKKNTGEVWIHGRSGVTHGTLHSAQGRVLPRCPSWQAGHMTTKFRRGRKSAQISRWILVNQADSLIVKIEKKKKKKKKKR